MTSLWHQRQWRLVFLRWHWWVQRLRNNRYNRWLRKNRGYKMRLCMIRLNHLLRYMDKRIRYRWNQLICNNRRQSPSNLRYILDFLKRMNKRRVIIQRNLQGFLFLRIWQIQLRQQLRKPNKIHIVLDLWRLGRHLWWPNWRKRKLRFHHWFRLGFLPIRGRWFWIHHWRNRRIDWFLWCMFGWSRHCV